MTISIEPKEIAELVSLLQIQPSLTNEQKCSSIIEAATRHLQKLCQSQ